jgi:hypothetical protein
VLPLVQAPRETKKKKKKPNTSPQHTAAIEAFGKGMLALDSARRGDISEAQRSAFEAEARSHFQAAVAADTRFELARVELMLLEAGADDLSNYETQILAETERPSERDERLIRSGTIMGLGPVPGHGGTMPGDLGARPRAKSGSGTITIGGTLP